VDTVVEELTKTVSRQKLTASETMHDNEYQIILVISNGQETLVREK
jgi:hypothetical protein